MSHPASRSRFRALSALAACLLTVTLPVRTARSDPPLPPISVVSALRAPVEPKASRPARPASAESTPRDPAAPAPPWLLVYRLTDLQVADPERQIGATADVLREARAVRDNPGPFALSTSFDDAESADLRTVVAQGERWHLLRFDGVAASRPLEAKVTAFGQVAYVPREADDEFAPGPAYAPALLGVSGELAGFEVGARYLSIGKRLERVVGDAGLKKDQEGGEVWLARRFGMVRLRLSQSDLADNVDRNPALPRTTRSQTAVTAELSVPAWPMVSVTYGTGDSERVRLIGEGHAGTRERQESQSVTGSAYYVGAGWDIAGSTTYILTRDARGTADDSSAVYGDLSLSLRPTDSLTVTPTLSAGRERYEAIGTRWDTGSASVTLSFSPPRSRWYAWSTTGYTGFRSTDGLAQGSGISISGGLGRDLARIGTLRSALSLEAGYDQYRDGAAPRNSSGGAFAFVLFKVSGF